MEHSRLIAPIVALVAWTLVMLVWMAAKRFPLLRGRDIPNGARGSDLERAVPGKPHWPAHNYIHLMEQPTIFYAIVVALILIGADYSINVWLAWAYVGLRIAHSIVQATVNSVRLRFALFALSTFCLLGLTVHAAAHLIHNA